MPAICLQIAGQNFMHTEPQIDIHALLPAKRRMVRVAAVSLLLSLSGGLLLGLLVYKAPHSALALALGNVFVAGGPAVFSAPGAGLLALGAGLVWGFCLAFVAAFGYTAWLFFHVRTEHNRLAMEQRMDAYRRAIAGKPAE